MTCRCHQLKCYLWAVVDPSSQEVNITLIATGFGSQATFPDSSLSSYLDRSPRRASPPPELWAFHHHNPFLLVVPINRCYNHGHSSSMQHTAWCALRDQIRSYVVRCYKFLKHKLCCSEHISRPLFNRTAIAFSVGIKRWLESQSSASLNDGHCALNFWNQCQICKITFHGCAISSSPKVQPDILLIV